MTPVEINKLVDECVTEEKWLKDLYLVNVLSENVTYDKKVLVEYGFDETLDIRIQQALQDLTRNNLDKAFRTCNKIYQLDPYNPNNLQVFLCVLVEMKKTNFLFSLAHKLIKADPKSAIAWYAIGCYYYAAKEIAKARTHFRTAIEYELRFAPAWIGYGHTYSLFDEGDQGRAAFRRASQFFPASHVPFLNHGSESLKDGSFLDGKTSLEKSLSLCDTDPLVYNELGVYYYRTSEYDKAIELFKRGIDITSKARLGRSRDAVVESIWINLGSSQRKLGLVEDSIVSFKMAMRANSKNPISIKHLGFSYHILGDLDTAIREYTKALGIDPRDEFARSMLNAAMEDRPDLLSSY